VSRRAALAAALLCLALLAGCGSSDSGEGTAGGQAAARSAPPPRVIVETAASGFDAAEVYREAAPGVVTIRSIFGSDNAAGGAAEGSGFVLDDSGRIVTNAHVVTDESSGARVPAKQVFVEFPDRNVVEAKIVGFDPFADVALLKVDPDGFTLHPLELGNDADLQVGQPVAAIGSPFGEMQSLSSGIISATDRSVKSLTDFQIEGAIQTDASINPGNSGGPLLDAGARVIGINQQIETGSGSNSGVASPSRSRRSSARSRSSRKTAAPNTPTSASPARRSTRSSPPSSASTPPSAACWPKSCRAGPPSRPVSRVATRKSNSRPASTAPAATSFSRSTATR
jgi:S1-C subfamily serine protease